MLVATDRKKLLNSKRDAADVLGVSTRTIDNLILRKELRTVKVGRRTMIHEQELQRFAKTGTE